MESGSKRAILAVSFGTSHNDTCQKTIEKIEEAMRNAYPQYPLYRAWTSKIVRRILLNRDHTRIFGVCEAMERMKEDGVREVVVQPTHMLNGIENDRMIADVMAYREVFDTIVVGDPLLTTTEDCREVLQAAVREIAPAQDETLIFMGHGTPHHANFVYPALNYILKDMGYENIMVGTVESYPSIGDVLKELKKSEGHKVLLAPLMVVAGDHAVNDLSGAGEDSWKSILEKEGYEVSCMLKGLGEFGQVRKIYLEHLKAAMDA